MAVLPRSSGFSRVFSHQPGKKPGERPDVFADARGFQRHHVIVAALQELSQRLTSEFGRGFDARNLHYMRQFFLAFPGHRAPGDDLEPGEKLNAPRSEAGVPAKWNALRSRSSGALKRDASGLESGLSDTAPSLRPELPWTHYRLLLGVEDPAARAWYMQEAAGQRWSTRQFERQLGVFYYERLLASRKKAPVRKEAGRKADTRPNPAAFPVSDDQPLWDNAAPVARPTAGPSTRSFAP